MKQRVLFVEDYPVIQDLYGDALRKEGFDVDVVDDGSDALEKVGENEYDFILLDLLLPTTSGIEFLEGFEGRDQTRIIILSDFAYQGTVDKAFNLGVDNYWIKSDNAPSQLAEKLVDYQGPDESRPEGTETGLA